MNSECVGYSVKHMVTCGTTRVIDDSEDSLDAAVHPL